MQGVCSFCGTEGTLIKAHLIPSSLYDRKSAKAEALLVATTETPGRVSRSWTGIYDPNLVCRKCEDLWDPWDSYAAEFLRNINSFAEPLHHNGKLIGLRVEDYDFEKLKLFFLSVAWRCGASKRKEFSMVKLGPYATMLKEAIENNDPDHPASFDVSIHRFDDTKLGTAFLNPHCERWDGINLLRLYMFGFTVLVKTDRRPMPSVLRRFRMKKGEPLYICIRQFKGGPEHRLMLRMVRGDEPAAPV